MPDGTFKVVEKDDQFNPPEKMKEEGKFERVCEKLYVRLKPPCKHFRFVYPDTVK